VGVEVLALALGGLVLDEDAPVAGYPVDDAIDAVGEVGLAGGSGGAGLGLGGGDEEACGYEGEGEAGADMHGELGG
jgi:hypothetical protein